MPSTAQFQSLNSTVAKMMDGLPAKAVLQALNPISDELTPNFPIITLTPKILILQPPERFSSYLGRGRLQA